MMTTPKRWEELTPEQRAEVRFEMGACSDTGLRDFLWSQEAIECAKPEPYVYWNATIPPEWSAAL